MRGRGGAGSPIQLLKYQISESQEQCQGKKAKRLSRRGLWPRLALCMLGLIRVVFEAG